MIRTLKKKTLIYYLVWINPCIQTIKEKMLLRMSNLVLSPELQMWWTIIIF
jgi:hypothetical protein